MIYNGFGISVNKCINGFYQIEIYQQCSAMRPTVEWVYGWWKIWFIPTTLFATSAHVVYMEDKKLVLVPLRLSKENILRASRGRVEPIIFLLCGICFGVRCALFEDGKVIIFFAVRGWRGSVTKAYTDIEQVGSIRSSEQFFVIEIIQLDNARWRVIIKWFSVNNVCYCACVLFCDIFGWVHCCPLL